MVARVNVALLLAALVLGCDSTRKGGIEDTGGRGGNGNAGTSGIGGNSNAGSGGNGNAGTSGIGGNSNAGTSGGGTAGGNIDASQPTDAACVPFEQTSVGSHPDILVLLDASGSMDNDTGENNCDMGCGAKSKWALT